MNATSTPAPPLGLLILGYGGHARAVADVALASGIGRLLFVDDNAKPDEHFLGHPVVTTWPVPVTEGWSCLPASGDNRTRRRQLAMAREAGWPIATLIAPSATLGAGARVAEGCFVARHAHVGPMARLGEGCIINTGAIVEHECLIGDFVHISINSAVAGRSTVGDHGFVGVSATVIDGIHVCGDVIIGAGAVVIRNIEQPGTYVGVPVRRVAPVATDTP